MKRKDRCDHVHADHNHPESHESIHVVVDDPTAYKEDAYDEESQRVQGLCCSQAGKVRAKRKDDGANPDEEQAEEDCHDDEIF